jgi:hypothetical protein
VARITDAIADMSKPPPGGNVDFVFVQGLSGLNAYLVERRAEITLPLLLAIQRRTAISRKPLTPLSSRVWRDAGNPPKNRRVAILARLREMPELVTLQEDRHFTFRYRVGKGPACRQIEGNCAEDAEVMDEEELLEEEI